MGKGTCLASLIGKVFLSLILVVVLPHSAAARAEATVGDVLPSAFGESIDTLDDETSKRCIGYADHALLQLLKDFGLIVAREMPDGGYLQILQTTVFLPEGQLPADADDIERKIWAELYADAACVVSFVAIDDSMNFGGVLHAEFTGRFGDYIVREDGSVESTSLRGVRARYYQDYVLPGVRVINLGSHYNIAIPFPPQPM